MAGQFGSRHFGTKPFLAEALFSLGKADPVVMYVGAANADDRAFGEALVAVIKAAGAAEVLWPKLYGRRAQRTVARQALEQADLVFVGGGDVEAGMRTLVDASLVDELHAAADRGVALAGLSAGAIMLGERWIRWPHETAADSEAETYACLGLAPCSLDTHGEGDDWRETRSFAAVRARELGRQARAYAVSSGGALVVDAAGRLSARGEPVAIFVAAPNEPPRMEAILEVEG